MATLGDTPPTAYRPCGGVGGVKGGIIAPALGCAFGHGGGVA
jgi:hypothetical protein